MNNDTTEYATNIPKAAAKSRTTRIVMFIDMRLLVNGRRSGAHQNRKFHSRPWRQLTRPRPSLGLAQGFNVAILEGHPAGRKLPPVHFGSPKCIFTLGANCPNHFTTRSHTRPARVPALTEPI